MTVIITQYPITMTIKFDMMFAKTNISLGKYIFLTKPELLTIAPAPPVRFDIIKLKGKIPDAMNIQKFGIEDCLISVKAT